MPPRHHPPAASRAALRQLGVDLKRARLRRRIPQELLAARCFTTRATVNRVEQGDPSVSVGIYVTVIQSLGLLEGIATIAARDPVGDALGDEILPRRARRPKR